MYITNGLDNSSHWLNYLTESCLMIKDTPNPINDKQKVPAIITIGK